MAEIIIKKKVELDYLGEDYKDSYLTFKSIAVRDFPKIIKQLDKTDQGNDDDQMNAMLKVLEDHFVDGIFDKQKVDKEDIGKFDNETIVKCFQTLTGQDLTENSIDPKENSASKTTSTTEVAQV